MFIQITWNSTPVLFFLSQNNPLKDIDITLIEQAIKGLEIDKIGCNGQTKL